MKAVFPLAAGRRRLYAPRKEWPPWSGLNHKRRRHQSGGAKRQRSAATATVLFGTHGGPARGTGSRGRRDGGQTQL